MTAARKEPSYGTGVVAAFLRAVLGIRRADTGAGFGKYFRDLMVRFVLR
jgi:hypothetical protein